VYFRRTDEANVLNMSAHLKPPSDCRPYLHSTCSITMLLQSVLCVFLCGSVLLTWRMSDISLYLTLYLCNQVQVQNGTKTEPQLLQVKKDFTHSAVACNVTKNGLVLPREAVLVHYLLWPCVPVCPSVSPSVISRNSIKNS